MPLYVYQCPKCKAEYSEPRTIAERYDGPRCVCGDKMEFVMTPVYGIVKNPAVPKRSK